MKEIKLLVGGPKEDLPKDLLLNNKNQAWVGADFGAVRLCNAGIKPLLAVGDFDTATTKQAQLVKRMSEETYQLPPEKDYTDTEVSLLEIKKRFAPEKITVYGATGGRVDHLLANLFSVLRIDYPEFVPKVSFIDSQNVIEFYLPGAYEIKKIAQMKYLSFIALTQVKQLTLSDEKYTLFEKDLEFPTAYVSNEFVGDTAHFSFQSGVICVVQSRDKN